MLVIKRNTATRRQECQQQEDKSQQHATMTRRNANVSRKRGRMDGKIDGRIDRHKT